MEARHAAVPTPPVTSSDFALAGKALQHDCVLRVRSDGKLTVRPIGCTKPAFIGDRKSVVGYLQKLAET